jgi:protein-L-isoaspartate(D-aspartate) O-methyltransferase
VRRVRARDEKRLTAAVQRMTNVIDVKRGEKVLEIGTGSGVQSAYIANLTENAYTIEIIAPLAQRPASPPAEV